MTLISNDPTWWPLINTYRLYSYFIVAASVAVIYDWVLNFGQELELIWRERWSLMTVLYISVRYIGVLFFVTATLSSLPSVPVTDESCRYISFILVWTFFLVNTLLGVIMITRLYAMYQGSRKMLISLIVIFMAVTITSGVIDAAGSSHASAQALVLSGTFQCNFRTNDLITLTWIFSTVWEILTLCLAFWIVLKHFHELPRGSAGLTITDCFTVLIRTHLHYFVAFATASGFNLVLLVNSDSSSVGVQVYHGVFEIVIFMQMFVLGPRLVISVRSYSARLVTNSDEGTCMTAIAFQRRVYVSTSSDVDV